MKKLWNEQTLPKEAKKYGKRGQFRKGSSGAYQAACVLGKEFLDRICSHMDPSESEAYSEQEIRSESNKYTRRTDFSSNSPSHYNAAWKKGEAFLDKVCSHMPKWCDRSGENNAWFKWTDEKIENCANGYPTRGEFAKGNFSCYQTARSRGEEFFSKICKAMKPSNGSSSAEKTLLKIIKKSFPTARHRRFCKIFVPNKLHIKGFEIDIFVPELNRGIEFDGIYWHSFKGLKRSRPHWPDEDIHNYHEIKDSYFASIGIQILHIKEEDWIADQEGCIRRCLEFLSGQNS
jgi:hypothetical protein